MATHYEVLKVDEKASHEEIRRAYHDQARRWHPDHSAERSPGDAVAAETNMRLVNDAWRVLGDNRRRSAYDATVRVSDQLGRSNATSAGADGATATADDTAVRIDPRLLDPDYLRSRAHARGREVDVSHEKAIRLAPWLGLGFLLACIFIFTAYASRPSGNVTPPTLPGPPIPFASTSCLRRLSEGAVQEIKDCSGVHDGKIIAVRLPAGVCPPETTLELPVNDVVVCLQAL